MTETLRESPLHLEHKALGGRLVPFAGYAMPVRYEGVVQEHTAVRERVGIFDVSHMGELLLSGPKAVEVVDSLITNSLAPLKPGRALYTVCCNEQGTILDDLIVYRLPEDRVLVICNASNRAKIVGHFRKHAEGHCEFEDISDDHALIAVQGPEAAKLLHSLGAERSATIKSFRVKKDRLLDRKVKIARTGYTGEDGFEILCSNECAPPIWRALVEGGATPCGLGARDTLRLEARLSLYGNEITEETNPYEAGLGWVVKLDKGDFVGRDALQKIKAEGTTRKLIGFEMKARGIARHGHAILIGDDVVGEVTSGSPAPTVGKNIGLGYVPKESASVGTEIIIDIRGKKVPAEIIKTPFYKRKGTK